MGRFIEAIEAIKDCAKPVVARLNGMVVGGGNELNIACDLAVAADDVVFRHVGPSRGSLPAGGATQWMPLLVGDRRAREVLLLNRPVTAAAGARLGLGQPRRAARRAGRRRRRLLRRAAGKMPEIVRATRVQLNFWKNLSWAMTVQMAREWLTVHAASAEVAGGPGELPTRSGRPTTSACGRTSRRPAGRRRWPSDPATTEIHDA